MTAYRFVGTPLDLTEGERYHFQKHRKRLLQSGRLLRLEHAEFDLEALMTPVLLDCANCRRAHRESCCEGGFPFPPSADLLPVIDAHREGILARLEEPVRAHIAEHGFYEDRHLETCGHPTIGTYAGNCLFARIETAAAGPACMAHRQALEEGLHPEQLKPLSCLLYPLDLIQGEDGRIFVTALTKETARFSRWGADYRLDFLCANYELRRRLADGTAGGDLRPNIRQDMTAGCFPLERYRPAYVEGRDLLLRRFGEEVWDEVHRLACARQAKEDFRTWN